MDGFPPLPAPPPGGEPEREEPVEEERGHRGGIVVVAVVGALALAAATVAIAVRGSGSPGACEGSTVESARFGYCIAAPGWRLAEEQHTARLPYDELIKPEDAATMRIVAIELDAGQDLDVVVQTVRSLETEDGVGVGDVVDRQVAGVPAAQWDIELDAGDSDARQIREVVFVREDTAWRVQLLAEVAGFDVRADEFDAILRSWTFR